MGPNKSQKLSKRDTKTSCFGTHLVSFLIFLVLIGVVIALRSRTVGQVHLDQIHRRPFAELNLCQESGVD